jgi:hypothetical protein
MTCHSGGTVQFIIQRVVAKDGRIMAEEDGDRSDGFCTYIGLGIVQGLEKSSNEEWVYQHTEEARGESCNVEAEEGGREKERGLHRGWWSRRRRRRTRGCG